MREFANMFQGFHRGFIRLRHGVLVHCIYISFAAFKRNFIPREQEPSSNAYKTFR